LGRVRPAVASRGLKITITIEKNKQHEQQQEQEQEQTCRKASIFNIYLTFQSSVKTTAHGLCSLLCVVVYAYIFKDTFMHMPKFNK